MCSVHQKQCYSVISTSTCMSNINININIKSTVTCMHHRIQIIQSHHVMVGWVGLGCISSVPFFLKLEMMIRKMRYVWQFKDTGVVKPHFCKSRFNTNAKIIHTKLIRGRCIFQINLMFEIAPLVFFKDNAGQKWIAWSPFSIPTFKFYRLVSWVGLPLWESCFKMEIISKHPFSCLLPIPKSRLIMFCLDPTTCIYPLNVIKFWVIGVPISLCLLSAQKIFWGLIIFYPKISFFISYPMFWFFFLFFTFTFSWFTDF